MSKPRLLSKRAFLKVFNIAADKVERNIERDYVACLALENAMIEVHGSSLVNEKALKKFFALYMKPKGVTEGARWFGEIVIGRDDYGFPIYAKAEVVLQNQKRRMVALRLMHYMVNSSPKYYYKQYTDMFADYVSKQTK